MTDADEPRDLPAPDDDVHGATTDGYAVAEDAPVPTDPGDVALLALIDRLALLLDRSELTELEIQVGGTGLVLRKPAAVPAGPPAASGRTGVGGDGCGSPGG